MLQRAAELLENHYPIARIPSHSGPFSQAFFPYPHSPAFIGGNNGVFLLTPQPLTPRFNPTAMPHPGADTATYHLPQPNLLSSNYLHQPPVSTSGEHGGLAANHRHTYPPPPTHTTAFPFPEVHHHGDESVTGEVKSEPTQITSPLGMHKPQHMFMPFVPRAQVGYDSTFGSTMGTIPLSHSGQCNVNSNNNNNNRGTPVSDSMAPASNLAPNQSHSLAYVPRFFPGALPPSPGFIVAPPCKCSYNQQCSKSLFLSLSLPQSHQSIFQPRLQVL